MTNEDMRFISRINLPELPEPSDDISDLVTLVIFRQNNSAIILMTDVALEDAQEYCNREDTSGGGWFVGYRRA